MKKRIWSLLMAVAMSIGLLPTTVFAADETVKINEANFPDAAFRACVQQLPGGADDVFTPQELEAITEIICEYEGITDLTGIQYFTELTKLDCCRNQLTSLDVSKNKKLQTLDCYDNQLASLDVTGNPALKDIGCSTNQLTSLDVSQNPELTELNVTGNKITSLDISANTKLVQLMCSDNQLKTLDLTDNPLLERLSCGDNQLTQLNLEGKSEMRQVYCSNNHLTSLDLADCFWVCELTCTGNQLAVVQDAVIADALPGLDVTKTSNVRGGVFENGKVVFGTNSDRILYDYDCGLDRSATFQLDKTTAVSTAVVTFEIDGGTWADGSSDPKQIEVTLTGGEGTLSADQIPTGMKPAEDYQSKIGRASCRERV